MDLYEAVFSRKSVRHYKMELLPPGFFVNLKKYEQGLQPFAPELRFSLKVYNALGDEARIKGLFKVKAPYYLVLFSEPGESAQVNAGYLLEQIVLYMTSREIGTCYQGGARVLGAEAPDGMEPMMVLAFGKADEKLYRESFMAKRLPLKELCVFKEDPTEETRRMVQAARMAPSAMNGQPWRFLIYQNRIHVFMKKRALRLGGRLNLRGIDMGIMLYHLALAAEENWRSVEFVRMEQMASKEYKNNDYFLTVMLT